MVSKKNRFSRNSFPKRRASARHQLSWGSVSLYEGSTGLSVVVSKKVLPKAHDRNRLKRRIYAALSEVVKDSSPNVGVVVYPRSEALTTTFKILVSEIKRLIS